MEGIGKAGQDGQAQALVSRLFTRLRAEAPAYDWDSSAAPFHSSYDNWHVWGVQRPESKRYSSHLRPPPRTSSSSSSSTNGTIVERPAEAAEEEGNSGESKHGVRVVARISRHLLRIEREFKLAQRLREMAGQDDKHFVRPIQFVRLPTRQNGDIPLVASIFESPGPNYLLELVEFGPNFYTATTMAPLSPGSTATPSTRQPTPLPTFLDFAVGSAECCEQLHHRGELVHGELRSDAFHFNKETGVVRLINFGSGARSFENGLTSAGWSSLTSQIGVEHRLQFIAPEQTGRLPAEPDSRTDIYSLGILFWTMLANEPAFGGTTPLDIMQNVLSRRITPVDHKRPDVPPLLSRIIQRMTQKSMADRYQSTSGLLYDLKECRRMLREGDSEALNCFKLGSKDVSISFNLPTHLIGRKEELQAIVGVIERTAARVGQSSRTPRKGLPSIRTSSAFTGDRPDSALIDEIMSDDTSSTDRDRDSKLHSFSDASPHAALKRMHAEQHSQESFGSNEDHSLEPRLSADGRTSHTGSSFDGLSRNASLAQSMPQSGSLLRNLRRTGRCEVVAITGQTGRGKSSLLQSVQTHARSHGYYASAKFDQVKKAPFEPVFRVMSLLFKQIFSESNVNTEFHANIRALVRPVWGPMHSALELPPWLLSQNMNQVTSNGHAGRTASFSGANTSTSANCGDKGSTNTDWLRSGGTTRDRRFVSTFLDVLRLLALQKFLCLCLDDLQFADEESFELIHSVVNAGIPIVLILTFRDEESLPVRFQALLDNATKVELAPFREAEVSEYVAATLHRDEGYVLPLALFLHQKTLGVPFFVREMLDSCHRKRCIYYSWRTSQWEFDLDKVFKAFGDEYSSIDFVSRRLEELSANTKAFLCWASLLGNSFSFHLVKFVMSCECSKASPAEFLPPLQNDPVAALQGALASFAITSTDDEDVFRFTHDRYLNAAYVLSGAHSHEEMHYVTACAMMKHDPYDPSKSSKDLFDVARHICSATEVIKVRSRSRKPFRQLLYQAAEIAREQGARTISLSFLKHCMQLLAQNPWVTTGNDADYQETVSLVTQTAAAYWYLGDYDKSSGLNRDVLEHATQAEDRSAAYVINSRIAAMKGDSKGAYELMKTALSDLGHVWNDMNWEECDDEFARLLPLLKDSEPILNGTNGDSIDRNLTTTGALMVELLSGAFWSDSLLFYTLTLKIMQIYLAQGIFPQVAVGYVHLASIAIGRFDMVPLGIELGIMAKNLMAHFDTEAYTVGRGLTLHSLFIGHFETGFDTQLQVLEEGQEATIAAGDRILSLLNVGITAGYRIWASHELSEIEAYISDQSESFPNWEEDVRGGAWLMAVRQTVRALQGKTFFRSAAHVFDDDEHQTRSYHDFVASRATAPARPLSIYDTYRMVSLYRFGHTKEALELGETLMKTLPATFSMRYIYYIMFFISLCLIGKIRDEPESTERDQWRARVREYETKIRNLTRGNDVNYATWLHILSAETADIDGKPNLSVKSYEAAISHAVLHGNVLDEAMSYEAYAEFMIRMGATRPARIMVVDAIAAYQRTGGIGKAQYLTEKHGFLLDGTRSLSLADASTQTLDVRTVNTSSKIGNLGANDDELASQTSHDRTQAWLAPPTAQQTSIHVRDTSNEKQGTLNAIGLDMIDLASILESSQVLSSELQVDKLLAKLTGIISESTGADLCGLVVNDDDIGWTVASVAGPEAAMAANDIGQPLEKLADGISKQVTLYVLRFRESVFLQNVLEDERFAASAKWRTNNPEGKAMIALPIVHGDNVLLGAIYIEGRPRSFTDRNTTVLRLLVNQISISIANALLFKRLEKASASNAAMLDMQKQSLAQARQAEKKAKEAEAQAMEMVRLKEEAAKVKSMFLANVSHELRTPLNGVIGMSELLKSSKLNIEQEGYADSIRVCADTLLSVINDILDFSKLEAGKMQMFNVQLSLTETISEVVRALSYTNMERGLNTVEQLELDRDLLVMGDPVRLHQILMNLLSNAYKFTAKGTVTVKAVVEHENDSIIQVTCSVTDTGIGITEEQRKKLFLPFSQADSSTARSYGGTGLGLSICKAIIEIMKGRVWLTSEVGKGTTVAFSIPFQKVKREAILPTRPGGAADPMAMFGPSSKDAPEGDHPYTSLANVPRNCLKICIAEDNPINQKIAISFVQKLGFMCEAYGDGQQAVDALIRASADGNPFHLVLMDVQMPVLDGYHATREIRKNKDPIVRNVLVIAMTASAIRGDREKCLEAGMNNYLAKPVRAHVLKQMLEGYLNQDPKVIPDLQQQANALAKQVIEGVSEVPVDTAKPTATLSRTETAMKMETETETDDKTPTPEHAGAPNGTAALPPPGP